jgi:hypothetical protein
LAIAWPFSRPYHGHFFGHNMAVDGEDLGQAAFTRA